MNPLTTLPRPLALLLISACLGIFAPAMAKENKQTAALQCEQNGELTPCPGDNTANMEKPAKDKSFKAQAEDGTTQTEKKQKRKSRPRNQPAKNPKPINLWPNKRHWYLWRAWQPASCGIWPTVCPGFPRTGD